MKLKCVKNNICTTYHDNFCCIDCATQCELRCLGKDDKPIMDQTGCNELEQYDPIRWETSGDQEETCPSSPF